MHWATALLKGGDHENIQIFIGTSEGSTIKKGR